MKKHWMRIIAISIVVSVTQPNYVSAAAPAGCPSEWTIPKNLIEATDEQISSIFVRDFNTVVRVGQDSEYSFDGTNWKTLKNVFINLKKPALSDERNHDVGILESYFRTIWNDITLIRFGDLGWLNQKTIHLRTSLSVTKQGCGSSTTFYYQKAINPPGVEFLSFEEEIAKFKDRFQDYQQYETAIKSYKDCLARWKSFSGPAVGKKLIDYCYIPIRLQFTTLIVSILPEQPNCLNFYPGNSNVSTAVGVKENTNCTYYVLGFKGDNLLGWKDFPDKAQTPFYFDKANDKLVFFEKFQINSRSGINCTNGKLKKFVSGINPKCPKGFRKVS